MLIMIYGEMINLHKINKMEEEKVGCAGCIGCLLFLWIISIWDAIILLLLVAVF